MPGLTWSAGGLDLDKTARGELGPQRGGNAAARQQERPAVGMGACAPERRTCAQFDLGWPAGKAGIAREDRYGAPERWPDHGIAATPRSTTLKDTQREGHRQFAPQGQYRRSRRQALCRSLGGELPSRQRHADDPDRHAPHFRRREDPDRYKTTDQVERAHVEDMEYSYLYQDGDGFHFMNSETYDQVTLQSDIIGDQAAYLQEGMKVKLAIHEGLAVSIEMPQKVTLEITETEPAMKGQTASGSFKPAILSNGVRTMVPTHILPGTRVVVMTADGAYVERAKD